MFFLQETKKTKGGNTLEKIHSAALGFLSQASTNRAAYFPWLTLEGEKKLNSSS